MDLVKFTAKVHATMDDVHFIHLKAKGSGFDTLHNVTETYYKHLLNDYDMFAECCIMMNKEIPHPSNSVEYSEYKSDYSDFTYESGFTRLSNIISDLIYDAKEIHKNLDEFDLYAKIKLEQFIEFWSVEILYKTRRRNLV